MKKCSQCGHMNNSRAKFCEECGTSLKGSEPSHSSGQVSSADPFDRENFAHTLMTEGMSLQEKKNYERDMRRGTRFDDVEILEVEAELPQVDTKKLRPQEETDVIKEQDSEIEEKDNSDVKKKRFGWFRKTKTEEIEKSVARTTATKKEEQEQVQIPNLLDNIEVKEEEKVVRKFELPELTEDTEKPLTISQLVSSSTDEADVEQSNTIDEKVEIEHNQHSSDLNPVTEKDEKGPNELVQEEAKQTIGIKDNLDENSMTANNSLAEDENVDINQEDSDEISILSKEVVSLSQEKNVVEEKSDIILPKTLPIDKKDQKILPQNTEKATESAEDAEEPTTSTEPVQDAEEPMTSTEPVQDAEEPTASTEPVQDAEEPTASTESVQDVEQVTVSNVTEKTQEEKTIKEVLPVTESEKSQQSIKNDMQSDSSESTNSQPPNYKRLGLIIATILIILFAIMSISYFVSAKYYAKDAQISRFINSLDSKDSDKISNMLVSKEEDIVINSNTLQPFIKLLNEEESYTKSLEEFLLNADDGEVSDKQDIYWEKGNKKFFFFQEYQFILRPIDITVHTNKKDASIWLEGKEVAQSGSEKYSATLGPLVPGKYNLSSKWSEGDLKLENTYPKALSRTIEQNFEQINLNLLALNFEVQSNVKDANVLLDDKSVGNLKDGKLELKNISWHEDMQLQLSKSFGTDVVKTDKIVITEKQNEKYTLNFDDLITEELAKQVMDQLYAEMNKAMKDANYDYRKSLAVLFVDGEKNNSYKTLVQYIDNTHKDAEIEYISFQPEFKNITAKSALLSEMTYEVALVKYFSDNSDKGSEKMVQKYVSTLEGIKENGKFEVKIQNLGNPETVIEKVVVPPVNETQPVIADTFEWMDESDEMTSDKNMSDSTNSNVSNNNISNENLSSDHQISNTGLGEQITLPNNNLYANDKNQGINLSEGVNSTNSKEFLDKMYGVFQNATKDSDYQFEDAFATYFVGGKENQDYKDFVNYIYLCRDRKDHDYVVFTVKVLNITDTATNEVKITYEVTYETHYTLASGKATRVETFRYDATMVNDNGTLKVKNLGKATKVYDNHANE